jgi:molecular chaperone DnaK
MGMIQKLRQLVFRRVSERRKYPRVPLSVKVTKMTSGAFQFYQASNISLGGVFIKAVEPLPLGTRLRIQIVLPRRSIEVEGVVVRVMTENGYPTGMGVKFENLSPEHLQVIEEYVSQEM